MSSLDGYITAVLDYAPQPIADVSTAVRELVDATITANPDVVPVLLSDGLCIYDEDDRTWYARTDVALADRLYDLALRGIVGMTKSEVWLVE